MPVMATWPLRILYVLALLSPLPVRGIGASGWVCAATGDSLGVLGAVGMAVPLAFVIVRAFSVLRRSDGLVSVHVRGGVRALRVLGIVGMSAGVLSLVVTWILPTVVRRVFGGDRADDGIDFFVVGLVATVLGGLGFIGLLLFEFSRLLGFEREFRHRSAGSASAVH